MLRTLRSTPFTSKTLILVIIVKGIYSKLTNERILLRYRIHFNKVLIGA